VQAKAGGIAQSDAGAAAHFRPTLSRAVSHSPACQINSAGEEASPPLISRPACGSGKRQRRCFTPRGDLVLPPFIDAGRSGVRIAIPFGLLRERRVGSLLGRGPEDAVVCSLARAREMRLPLVAFAAGESRSRAQQPYFNDFTSLRIPTNYSLTFHPCDSSSRPD
jgi:hypothetical protein